MTSALTVLFLSCWLARRSRVSGQIIWPSPAIYLSPGRVIAPGEAVTIRCQCWCWSRRLFLYKDGSQVQELTVDGGGGEFIIPSAQREDEGVYSCRSHSIWAPPIWLDASHSVQVIVAETHYPKPSIWLSPSVGVGLGGAVTFRCRGRHQNMRFLLYKAGNPAALQDVEPAGNTAKFAIHSAGREDAGSYSCRYRTKVDPPVWSEPSDPVELGVAGLPAPRPSISASPSGVITLGQAVTIRCQCRCGGRRLLLYKDGIRVRELDADEDRSKFPITNVRREDGGVYMCRSRSRLEPPDWSDPSDSMWIIVVETHYPKPSIWLSPSREVGRGGAVTIHCRAAHHNVNFLLYKAGNPNVLQGAEPAWDMAEFPLRNVSQRDGGSYSCQYGTKANPPVWSELSDPVELTVVDIGYSKPSISLWPSRKVAPGGAVTIRCQCRQWGMRILLYKLGDPEVRRWAEPAGNLAEFPIRNASRQDAGSYSCRYSTKSNQPFWSEPSDPVELVVAEGTNPAAPQQPDPPMMETEGEGRTDPTQPAAVPAPTHPGSMKPAPPLGHPDFTYANIVRLELGAMVLLVLALILAEACYSRPRRAS